MKRIVVNQTPVQLNFSEGKMINYASDLIEEYVEFNKGDVGDPASLGR